jgi:hypothetical protein
MKMRVEGFNSVHLEGRSECNGRKNKNVTIAKLWKQSRCPTIDEWIKKMWYLYTMEFY